MSKYIIDVGDAYAEYICGKGDMLCLPVRINEFEDNWLNTNIPLMPYTEHDLEQIKKEAFKNGYDAACKDIDIKSKTNAAYRKGYQDATVKISSDEQAIAEKAYQSGLNDAWEAARKICLNESDGGLSAITVHDIFNTEHYRDALRDYTPAKAIEKIRQYEQKQEEIKVGDVVRVKNAPEVEIWVTYISDEDGGLLSGLALKTVGDNCDIGDTYANRNIYNFERTGKHYDVPTDLEKMRGEKDG